MSSKAEYLTLPVPDPGIATVLQPKWRSAVARLRQERSGTPLKLLLLGLVAAGFWSAIFGIAYRLLKYTRTVPELGDFLPGKMLAVALLAGVVIAGAPAVGLSPPPPAEVGGLLGGVLAGLSIAGAIGARALGRVIRHAATESES